MFRQTPACAEPLRLPMVWRWTQLSQQTNSWAMDQLTQSAVESVGEHKLSGIGPKGRTALTGLMSGL